MNLGAKLGHAWLPVAVQPWDWPPAYCDVQLLPIALLGQPALGTQKGLCIRRGAELIVEHSCRLNGHAFKMAAEKCKVVKSSDTSFSPKTTADRHALPRLVSLKMWVQAATSSLSIVVVLLLQVHWRPCHECVAGRGWYYVVVEQHWGRTPLWKHQICVFLVQFRHFHCLLATFAELHQQTAARASLFAAEWWRTPSYSFRHRSYSILGVQHPAGHPYTE